MLVTRSRHDIGNEYLYAYSEHIIQLANQRGWKIEKVENKDNVKNTLHSRLNKNRPDFVFFNGHGSDQTIFGYGNQPIIGEADASLLKQTIVFARSCAALNILGKTAIERGCKAFIGYGDNFIIPRTHEYHLQPLNDPVVKPVLEISNAVPEHLIKGASAEESVHMTKEKAQKLLLKMLQSQEPYHAATFKAIYHNHISLNFCGDAEAKCVD